MNINLCGKYVGKDLAIQENAMYNNTLSVNDDGNNTKSFIMSLCLEECGSVAEVKVCFGTGHFEIVDLAKLEESS